MNPEQLFQSSVVTQPTLGKDQKPEFDITNVNVNVKVKTKVNGQERRMSLQLQIRMWNLLQGLRHQCCQYHLTLCTVDWLGTSIATPVRRFQNFLAVLMFVFTQLLFSLKSLRLNVFVPFITIKVINLTCDPFHLVPMQCSLRALKKKKKTKKFPTLGSPMKRSING